MIANGSTGSERMSPKTVDRVERSNHENVIHVCSALEARVKSICILASQHDSTQEKLDSSEDIARHYKHLIYEDLEWLSKHYDWLIKTAELFILNNNGSYEAVFGRLNQFLGTLCDEERDGFHDKVIAAVNHNLDLAEVINTSLTFEKALIDFFYAKFLVTLIKECEKDYGLLTLFSSNPDIIVRNILLRKSDENVKFIFETKIYNYVNQKGEVKEKEAKIMDGLIAFIFNLCNNMQFSRGVSFGHTEKEKSKIIQHFNEFHAEFNTDDDLKDFLETAKNANKNSIFTNYQKYLGKETDMKTFLDKMYKSKRNEFFDALLDFCNSANNSIRIELYNWQQFYNSSEELPDMHYSIGSELLELVNDFLAIKPEYKSFVNLGYTKAMHDQFMEMCMEFIGIKHNPDVNKTCHFSLGMMVKPAYYLEDKSGFTDYYSIVMWWLHTMLTEDKSTFRFTHSLIGEECDIRKFKTLDEPQKQIDLFFTRAGGFSEYHEFYIHHFMSNLLHGKFIEFVGFVACNLIEATYLPVLLSCLSELFSIPSDIVREAHGVYNHRFDRIELDGLRVGDEADCALEYDSDGRIEFEVTDSNVVRRGFERLCITDTQVAESNSGNMEAGPGQSIAKQDQRLEIEVQNVTSAENLQKLIMRNLRLSVRSRSYH